MYVALTSSSLIFSLPTLRYIVADPGYDDKELCEYSKSIGNRPCLSSVERYKSNSKEGLELVCFYESVLGQFIYNKRGISIEPLIEHIKSVFRIDQLPARGEGFNSVSAIVLISVLLYQIGYTITVKLRKYIQNR
jgi:hypothetical protein